ncbi:hypothetical protein ABTC41_17940, partial [Acinetobacter baumannii]
MMWIKFILYPLGMFVLWQAIFIITQLSLTSLNMPQVFVGIISLIINCGMQILIGYKIPHLAPKYKFVVSMIYAELSGDFPLGDSRQPTYKSLRP